MNDVVIVGGGIIGLAVGRAIQSARPQAVVTVIEKETSVGRHQTGRNSGVLHSGVYYRPGSLKARTALAGRAAMLRYCEERGIPIDVCGKVIVATRTDELGGLDLLEE